MVAPASATAVPLLDYLIPPCQVLSNAEEGRFACLGFPSLHFDYPSSFLITQFFGPEPQES